MKVPLGLVAFGTTTFILCDVKILNALLVLVIVVGVPLLL
jgi:succinate-acetate transporter protein